MIENIEIQNFKCWEDTGKIKLAPITVFFGKNSAGKHIGDSQCVQLKML